LPRTREPTKTSRTSWLPRAACGPRKCASRAAGCCTRTCRGRSSAGPTRAGRSTSLFPDEPEPDATSESRSVTRKEHLRRAPDRLRGGPGAPGGAGRHVAGGREAIGRGHRYRNRYRYIRYERSSCPGRAGRRGARSPRLPAGPPGRSRSRRRPSSTRRCAPPRRRGAADRESRR
jgi:hypothetical protein